MSKYLNSRNIFAGIDTVSVEACESLLDGMWEGDMLALVSMIRSAFGSDVLPQLVTTAAARGYVVDAKRSKVRLNVEGEFAISCDSPFTAVGIIMTAYAQATSRRNDDAGDRTAGLGTWKRPVNLAGEILVGSPAKLTKKGLVLGPAHELILGVPEFKGTFSGIRMTPAYGLCAQAKQIGELLGLVTHAREVSVKDLAKAHGLPVSKYIANLKAVEYNAPAGELLYNDAIEYLATKRPNLTWVAGRSHESENPKIYTLGDIGPMYMDREWYSSEVIQFCTLMSWASHKDKRFITVEQIGQDYEVWFETEHVTIKHDGVYDTRERRFMNIVLADSRVSGGIEAKEGEIVLVGSHGAFVLTVLEKLRDLNELRKSKSMGRNEPIGTWWRKVANSNFLPLDSEHEMGAITTGSRGDRLRNTATAYQWHGILPFHILISPEYGNLATTRKHEQQVAKCPASPHLLTRAAYRKYNMTQVPKGNVPFVINSNLDFNVFSIEEIKKAVLAVISEEELVILTKTSGPELWRKLQARCMVKTITKDSKGEKRNELKSPSSGETKAEAERELVRRKVRAQKLVRQQLLELLEEEGCEIAEDIKSKLVDVRKRAFHEYGGQTGVDVGHIYRAGVFQQLINAPGVIFLLRDLLKPFLVRHNIQKEVESYVDDLSLWKFKKRSEISTIGRRSVMTYTEPSIGIDASGGAVEETGLWVEKDELIVSVPGKNAKDEVVYTHIYADHDGFVHKLVWWEVEMGGSDIVVIQVQAKGVERDAKLRYTFKALVGRPSAVMWSENGRGMIDHPINHALNARLGLELPEVDIITTGDSDKSKDMLQSILDIVCETLVTNDRSEEIKKLNDKLSIYEGIENEFDDETLEFHLGLAFLGEYDEIYKDFFTKYGREVWFYHRDPANALVAALREMWIKRSTPSSDSDHKKSKWVRRTYAELLKACPEVEGYDWGVPVEELLIVTSNIYKDGCISKYDEIFVMNMVPSEFVVDGYSLPDFFWQRSWGFIGNQLHGDVTINAKVELCSVTQAISNGPSMSATARSLEVGVGLIEGNPADAAKLVDEYNDRYRKQWLAIQSMAKGACLIKDDEYLPEVALFAEKGGINPELLPYLETIEGYAKKAEEGYPELFSELAEAFKDVVLCGQSRGDEDNGWVKLYLPAINFQSSNSEHRQSLTGMVADVITGAINGRTNADYVVTLGRIKGALKGLAESPKLEKSMFMARPSSQGKTLSGFGFEVDEHVEIKGSVRWKATVRSAIDAGIIPSFKEADKLNGMLMLITRPPIAFPVPVKYLAVPKGHPKAKLANEAQDTMCSLVIEATAGDNDGDGYTCVFAPDLELKTATKESCLAMIQGRIGYDPLSKECEQYICDHYVPKCWKPGLVENPRLFQAEHLGFKTCIPANFEDDSFNLNDPTVSVRTYSAETNVVAATQVQKEFVPYTHRLYVSCEIASGLANLCNDIFEEIDETWAETFSSTFLKYKELPLPISELYEGGTLGGLAWPSYCSIRLLKYISDTQSLPTGLGIDETGMVVGLYKFSENLTKGSINAGYAKAYIEGALMLGEMVNLLSAKGFTATFEEIDGLNVYQFKNDEYNISSLDYLRTCEKFVHLVGYVMYELLGGRFNPQVDEDGKLNGYAVAACVLFLYPQRHWERLKERSIVMRQLHAYLDECLIIKCPGLATLLDWGVDEDGDLIVAI